MVRTPARLVGIVLSLALLGGGAFPGPAAGRSGALERALGGAFEEAEAARIERSFRAAVQGGVEERLAADLVRICVEGGFEAEALVRVLSLAAQLALEELPVASFAAKVEEGVAKGVPAARVVQAAEARALTLNQARGLVNAAVLDGLEVDDRDGLAADVAAALEAGREPEGVREILGRARDEGWGYREIRRRLFP